MKKFTILLLIILGAYSFIFAQKTNKQNNSDIENALTEVQKKEIISFAEDMLKDTIPDAIFIKKNYSKDAEVIDFIHGKDTLLKKKEFLKGYGEFNKPRTSAVAETTTIKDKNKNKKTYTASATSNFRMDFSGKIDTISYNTHYNLTVNWNMEIKNNAKAGKETSEYSLKSLKITKITGKPIIELSSTEQNTAKNEAKKLIEKYYNALGNTPNDAIGLCENKNINVQNELKYKEDNVSISNMVSTINNTSIEYKDISVSETKITNIELNNGTGEITAEAERTLIDKNIFKQKFTISFKKNGQSLDNFKIKKGELIEGNDITPIEETKKEEEVVVVGSKGWLEKNAKDPATKFVTALNEYVAGGAKDKAKKDEIISMFESSKSTIEVKCAKGNKHTRTIARYLSKLSQLSSKSISLTANTKEEINVSNDNNTNLAEINYTQDFKNPSAKICDYTIKKIILVNDKENNIKIRKILVENVTECNK